MTNVNHNLLACYIEHDFTTKFVPQGLNEGSLARSAWKADG